MILLQMAGFPGSGKSGLSKIISKEINAVIIDKDTIKTSLLEYGEIDHIASELAYKMMFDLADFHLNNGQNVILDTPCYYDEGLEKGMKLAHKNNVEYKFIECIVDDFTIIKNRIASRKNMKSQITMPSIEGFTRAKGRTKRPDNDFLLVDTSEFVDIDYSCIFNYLKKSENNDKKIGCLEAKSQ